MTGTGPLLRGLVCEDDAAITRAILVVMDGCGFRSVSVVPTGQEALDSAARSAPQLAVMDVALAGARGLGLIGDLVRVAPECKVVAVSPFPSLRPIAIAAGAAAFCGLSDLRQLELCLQHALQHAAVSPDVCDCNRATERWPSGASRSGSFWDTTSGASWIARYQSWPPK